MSAAADSPTPESGNLSDRPLPRLLLDLYRERFSGEIELSRERIAKSIRLHEGAPVASESNLASESLASQLVEAGTITEADQSRVASYVAQKHCQEGSAVLALSLVQPKVLFVALKTQLTRRVVDCFGWPDGEFSLRPAAGQDAAQPFRCDPYRLVQDGLMAHWSPERILADLSSQLERFPRTIPALSQAIGRLRQDPTSSELFAAIDGSRTTAQIVAAGIGSTTALAGLWVAHTARLLDYHISAEEGAPDRLEDRLGGEFEIEVEVRGAASAVAEGPTRVAVRTRTSAAPSSSTDDQSAAMRFEIDEKSTQLDQLDFYGVLGITQDATAPQIKKAYFSAAKRYHPDALARLGLEDMKEQAGAVFGRIAEAYETLSADAKRKSYDLSLQNDGPEIDTARVAQAETFYRKGEILIRMGDFRGSLEYLKPAVELWPEEAAYQSALGWAYFKQSPSDPDAARGHLEHAIQLAPDDPVVNFRLGMLMRSVGELERGEELLARAKKLES